MRIVLRWDCDEKVPRIARLFSVINRKAQNMILFCCVVTSRKSVKVSLQNDLIMPLNINPARTVANEKRRATRCAAP